MDSLSDSVICYVTNDWHLQSVALSQPDTADGREGHAI